METRHTRRQALRWASAAAMATTFFPGVGRHRAWAHPAENKLATRVLGRTGREVATFGLAGGNKVMWNQPGDEAVKIVVKAVRAGVTYLETANNYQLSQLNYGKAFEILNLKPGRPGYDAGLRGRLFVATKTGLRTAIVRGNAQPMGSSAGGGKLVVEDLERALTQFFGDGKGFIPEGAYLDLMQIHHIGFPEEVAAVYEGYDNPADKTLERVGALAALIDYRDGSNLTGLNPKSRKWIRHIGITGHENPAVHMEAIQRDSKRVLDTLLVVCNPNDPRYFCHQTNSIPVAHAAGMGIIGMKVFADGVMYGLERKYASQPGQSVLSVGQPGKVSHEDFIRYTLNPDGMSTLITGIGLIDETNDPEKDQVVANLAACQTAGKLTPLEKKEIEDRVAALHGTQTNFFQRPSVGFQPPQDARVRRVDEGTVEVSWHNAYAAGEPIERYEVWRRDERLATIPYKPQISKEPFRFTDRQAPRSHMGGLWYHVRAVDAAGRTADTLSQRA
jgi:aryl-alcohol dehydrogenase-like predicted oxidoreductase